MLDVMLPNKEGALEVDLSTGRATFAGKPLHLKPKEFDLLAFMICHRGQAFSPDQLLQQVWGYDPTRRPPRGPARATTVALRG